VLIFYLANIFFVVFSNLMSNVNNMNYRFRRTHTNSPSFWIIIFGTFRAFKELLC